MKLFFACLLFNFFAVLPAFSAPEKSGKSQSLGQSYSAEKDRFLHSEQKSREVMSSIYEINQRMKSMSKRRDILNNRMISAEGNIKVLAPQIAALEIKLKEQNIQLSRRLRVMYMLGEESSARLAFTSSSPEDLTQTIKYLNIISQHDLELIKSYQANLEDLNKKRERLNGEVKRLIQSRQQVQNQEQLLSKDQNKKAQILSKLKLDKDKALRSIKKIRTLASAYNRDSEIAISFFEMRGQLPPPAPAQPRIGFGPLVDDIYHYRLSHKGYTYDLPKEVAVSAIYEGRATFVGEVPGHGWTIVIDHGDHYYSVYAKMNRPLIGENEDVIKNQILAKSSGELYFEIRHFSDAIDPASWIKNI